MIYEDTRCIPIVASLSSTIVPERHMKDTLQVLWHSLLHLQLLPLEEAAQGFGLCGFILSQRLVILLLYINCTGQIPVFSPFFMTVRCKQTDHNNCQPLSVLKLYMTTLSSTIIFNYPILHNVIL